MLEYPELNQAYELQVKMGDKDIMEKESLSFWNRFLEKNHHYQTEPFGGTNPIYIPQPDAELEKKYETDYEDRKNNRQGRVGD